VKISTFRKRITVLVLVSMLFCGSLWANNSAIIENGLSTFNNLNKKIDTKKYGKLSKYKIGNVSLEEFIQVRNTENRALKIVNDAVDDVKKLDLSQKQEDSVKKLSNDISNRIKIVNNQKLKNSTTFSGILVDNAKGMYDAIKATPTIAKYEAKFLVPGASKALNKMKATYGKLANQAAGGVEILQFGGELIKTIEPFFKKGGFDS